MEHPHDVGHVGARREGFSVLSVLEVEDLFDVVKWRLVSVLVNQIDQTLPVILAKATELSDVLLVLTIGAEGYSNHVGRPEAP